MWKPWTGPVLKGWPCHCGELLVVCQTTGWSYIPGVSPSLSSSVPLPACCWLPLGSDSFTWAGPSLVSFPALFLCIFWTSVAATSCSYLNKFSLPPPGVVPFVFAKILWYVRVESFLWELARILFCNVLVPTNVCNLVISAAAYCGLELCSSK